MRLICNKFANMKVLGKMRVIQVVPSLIDEADGVAYASSGIAMGLVKNNVLIELHCAGRGRKYYKNYSYKIVNHKRLKFPFYSLGRSPMMLKALKCLANNVDIIHTNGLWMMPNIYPAWAVRGTNCKFVLQPHGTLSPWALANSKWKKRLMGWFAQYAAMRAVDLWIATCEEEYQDIRRLGYRQPIAILPNGVDLPMDMDVNPIARRRMFFLSRIHPKKNVALLLRCWAKLEEKFQDWDLSIVGPDKDNPYADEMKQLAKDLGCQRVTFEGELNGAAKHRFMAESECEVLPTHSENFGMVVAEALACKTPVICSHGAPWAGLETNQCGWWVPTTEEAFLNAMTEAMSKTRDELCQMGERGREWMAHDFSWDGIGAKMKAAYAWLLGQGEKPDFVRIN